jgi:hypothetical protein
MKEYTEGVPVDILINQKMNQLELQYKIFMKQRESMDILHFNQELSKDFNQHLFTICILLSN